MRPPPLMGGGIPSEEQVAFLVLPLWLRHLADVLDARSIDLDTGSIRSAADEIERLRRKYEPEWASSLD